MHKVESITTELEHLFEHMSAGVFKQKVEALLCECASGVINHGQGKKVGKITIQLTLKQVGDNNQINISHSIQSETPTRRGKKAELDTTETTFHVGRGGSITFHQPREDIDGQFSLGQQSDGTL